MTAIVAAARAYGSSAGRQEATASLGPTSAAESNASGRGSTHRAASTAR